MIDQTGFRANRGAEPALHYVRERFVKAADAGIPVALVLLDLSAAFDTVDHKTLLLLPNALWSDC